MEQPKSGDLVKEVYAQYGAMIGGISPPHLNVLMVGIGFGGLVGDDESGPADARMMWILSVKSRQ